MTIAGWIFMFVSIGAVLSLVTYCYYRILTAPQPSAGLKRSERMARDSKNEG
jgi:hypothetical protein